MTLAKACRLARHILNGREGFNSESKHLVYITQLTM